MNSSVCHGSKTSKCNYGSLHVEVAFQKHFSLTFKNICQTTVELTKLSPFINCSINM